VPESLPGAGFLLTARDEPPFPALDIAMPSAQPAGHLYPQAVDGHVE